MRAIILCAGKGNRMNSNSPDYHKSLLKINDRQSFLSRILHQLLEYDFKEVLVITGYNSRIVENELNKVELPIKIIYNNLYDEDTNIWSMKLGLENISKKSEPLLIIEADTYISDLSFNKIINVLKKNTSTWFTKGNLMQNQTGGILKSRSNNFVSEIKIIDNYNPSYKNYFKLTGLMVVESNHIDNFLKLINIYSKQSIKQYYLKPWYENLKKLPSKYFDLDNKSVASCNTKQEYITLKKSLIKRTNNKIELININELFPIEGFINERKNKLYKKILNFKIWNTPIIIEKNHNLILDGHHRFQVAKLLNLDLIPCIKINYEDVDIWSLRYDIFFNKNDVIQRAKKGQIYPSKTVKHDFDFLVGNCSYSFKELKK